MGDIVDLDNQPPLVAVRPTSHRSAFTLLEHVGGEREKAGERNSNSIREPKALKALCKDLLTTYRLCNSSYLWDATKAPRRTLTKPCEAVGNKGWDNINADSILRVGDIIGEEPGH
eukprot:Ihof_evm4s264 gene=Ihof_evmTU4s264